MTYQFVVFQITSFGLAGGMTTKERDYVENMNKTPDKSLAMNMNWRGANGKQAFERLALKGIALSKFPFRATAWERCHNCHNLYINLKRSE